MLKLTKEEWELERIKEKDYWVLQNLGKQINECKLSSYYGMVQLDGAVNKGIAQGCNLRDLFDTYEEAEIRALELDNLYNGIFKHKPYLSEDKLVTNLYELIEIEKKINEGLSDYPQFDGIDFCDVSASGIQIRGFHKQVKGYCFGSQITIKYDFSNYKDCITEFIEMWKARDTHESLKQYQSFLDAGDRWGWD